MGRDINGYAAPRNTRLAGRLPTVLDDVSVAAIRMMLGKLSDHDVTQVYETVGGVGPIGDLAAQAMKDCKIDF